MEFRPAALDEQNLSLKQAGASRRDYVYVCFQIQHEVTVIVESERKGLPNLTREACVVGTQRTYRPLIIWSIKMNRLSKIAVAVAAALAAQGALANVLPPNAVPEPGALGLVGVALAAAVYFGKRRK